MSEPRARPAAALLARKGLAAPVGAASHAASAPALFPVAESLPEVVALVRAGAPPASLLPLDFLAGWHGARDLAPRPPDPTEVAVVPAVDPEAKLAPSGTAVPELSAKPEAPRPDPALRIDAGAGPATRAEPRRFPALAAGLVLALGLGATGYSYQNGWFVFQPPERPPAPPAAALACGWLPMEFPPRTAPTLQIPRRPPRSFGRTISAT